MDNHFTVSIFIVFNKKVLLHLHKKANKILPLGGHIEPNELPEETCVREVLEESGLDITLYNKDNKALKTACKISNEKLLINPIHTIFGEVSKGHGHIDFVYYATSSSDTLNPAHGESTLLRWYSRKDLQNSENIQANILNMANEALDLLSTTQVKDTY